MCLPHLKITYIEWAGRQGLVSRWEGVIYWEGGVTDLPSRALDKHSAIADVAVRKRHRGQDDIMIVFTRTILESAKLFFCRKRTRFMQAKVV